MRSTLRTLLGVTLCFALGAPRALAQDPPIEGPPVQEPPPQDPAAQNPDDPYPVPESLRTARVVFHDEAFEFDKDHPIVGEWLGNLSSERGVPAVSLLVTRDEAGDYVAKGSVTPGNLPNREIEDLKVQGSRVTFTFLTYLDPQRIGRIHFDGEISEDGQRIKGTAKVPSEVPGQGIVPGEFEIGRSPMPLSLSTAKPYCGKIEIDEGIFFDINIVLASTPGGNWVGHIDIPLQAIAAWPFDHVEGDGTKFMIHMGGGAPSTLECEVVAEGATLKGVYHTFQDIPFELAYTPDYTVPAVETEFALPNAEEVKPYHTTEVTLNHPDGHFLAGSLTIPEGDETATFPAAILLTSSGPHQRDNNLYGQKVFDVVTDLLARRGIAVLRYDDRGVGQSGGRYQPATAEDFASDALAAYNALRAFEQVNPDRIGFVGHDEGANVATLAAAGAASPAFVVMLGGRGVTGDRYEYAQLEAQLAMLPEVDAQIKSRLLESHKALLAAFLADETPEKLQELATTFATIQKELAEAAGATETRDPAQGARLILANMRRPGLAYLARFDPLASVRALKCPLLAVWGSLDVESVAAVNAPALQEAATSAGVDVTVRLIDRHNHLLQRAGTGQTNEYAKARYAIEKPVVDEIASWILWKTGHGPEPRVEQTDGPANGEGPGESDAGSAGGAGDSGDGSGVEPTHTP